MSNQGLYFAETVHDEQPQAHGTEQDTAIPSAAARAEQGECLITLVYQYSLTYAPHISSPMQYSRNVASLGQFAGCLPQRHVDVAWVYCLVDSM